MAVYQVTDNEIKTISRTTSSETGLKEREDLQRLLKHQIEIISPDTLWLQKSLVSEMRAADV